MHRIKQRSSWRHLYQKHKFGAQRRGVDFLLTPEEWYYIWMASGHWLERGYRRGNYVMARFNDEGSYAMDNVHIITVEQNIKDAWKNPRADERRHRMRVKAIKARQQASPP